MQVGDLVWSPYHGTWGVIVYSFGDNNHHCKVLIDGEEWQMSKTKLEVVSCK